MSQSTDGAAARLSTHPSTGPRTAAGRAISCLNATKHGLTGSFNVLTSEAPELFDELRDALRSEYAPATPTEILLVDRLAEHTWLSQRAQRIADAVLSQGDLPVLALMLRYRTTHDRAFHKCLAELRTIRRERAQQPKGATQFESQKSPASVAQPTPKAATVSKNPSPHAHLEWSSDPEDFASFLERTEHFPSSNRKMAAGSE